MRKLSLLMTLVLLVSLLGVASPSPVAADDEQKINLRIIPPTSVQLPMNPTQNWADLFNQVQVVGQFTGRDATTDELKSRDEGDMPRAKVANDGYSLYVRGIPGGKRIGIRAQFAGMDYWIEWMDIPLPANCKPYGEHTIYLHDPLLPKGTQTGKGVASPSPTPVTPVVPATGIPTPVFGFAVVGLGLACMIIGFTRKHRQ